MEAASRVALSVTDHSKTSLPASRIAALCSSDSSDHLDFEMLTAITPKVAPVIVEYSTTSQILRLSSDVTPVMAPSMVPRWIARYISPGDMTTGEAPSARRPSA
ncbi:MAG: hypothetical protein AAFR52_05730, partial [Pseudomonadota bacterium]